MMKKLTLSTAIILLVGLIIGSKVYAANAPYLPPINDQTASIGELWTLDIDALYADPAETYELIVARPGMTINPSSGVISWTPVSENDGGSVTVRAFNSAGESSRSFLVFLSDAVVCPADIISYWKMDETSGTTYDDFVGGYTATSLTALEDTTGKVDRAALLKPLGKTDQFIYVEDQQQYDFARNEGFSISMWIYYKGQHTASSVNQALVARGLPSDTEEHMFLMVLINAEGFSPPKISYQLRPNNLDAIKTLHSSVNIIQNQWYHIVAVYDGPPSSSQTTTMRLFVNTQMDYTNHFFASNSVFNGGFGGKDLDIGYYSAFASNRYPFNGMIDEVVIYRKALSQTEVNNLYSDGLASKAVCKPGNYFPLITSEPITSVLQDQTYSYTLQALDYQGRNITLSAVTIPDWLTFNPSTGVLTGTPGNDDVDDHTITLKATVGETEVIQEFTLTVENVNDPPAFISTPVTIAAEDVVYSYNFQAQDPDGDDLIFSADTLPDWIVFNPDTRMMIGIPQRDDVGDNPVRISVTDGEYEVHQSFIIEVTSDNNSPIFTSSPLTMVDNYSHYMYQVTAFDADNDGLTFGSELLPSWTSFDPETHILSGIPEKQHVGDHDVILTVTDGYALVKQEFTIVVRDVNTRPTIVSVPEDTAKVNNLYTYLVEVVDHENDPITYTGTVVPGWMSFNSNTHILSGTPAQQNLGDHTVIITISDGMFTENHQFTIHVVPEFGVGMDVSRSLVSKIYPNPANTMLNVEFLEDVYRIEVSDLSGRVVIDEMVEMGDRSVTLDVSELDPGSYIYKVYGDGHPQTGKLIIN